MMLVAWALFVLGIAHVAFGLVRFKVPLAEAIADGFVGQFAKTEARRTAFWFLMSGPLLMALGQVAIHAEQAADRWLLGLIGFYLLASSGIGVVAFPKSPLWLPLLLSPFFIASGLG